MALKLANNQSLTAITALPASVSGGAMTLLQTQTASSSSTLSFTSNIDSTYKEYVFKFYDIHPATNAVDFLFQADTGTNTNYNQTITSTHFIAGHSEADDNTALTYRTDGDLAQSTSFQQLNEYNTLGNDNDQSLAGTLTIYEPSSSVFVKHFNSVSCSPTNGTHAANMYTAGYFNTTTALTRVQFKMDGGNIDSGVIKLYGIS